MPCVFQNSTAHIIIKPRFQEPISPPNEVVFWTSVDRLAGDSKLRAATHSYHLRHLDAGHQFLEGYFEHGLRRGGFYCFRAEIQGVVVRSNLTRASEDPDASEIDISRRLDVCEAQASKSRHGVVVGVVIMPSKARGVDEDSRVCDCIVAINEVTVSLGG